MPYFSMTVLWMVPSKLLKGLGVGFAGPDSSQSIALVNLILSGVVVVLLILALPWRRLRWPVPMPWQLVCTGDCAVDKRAPFAVAVSETVNARCQSGTSSAGSLPQLRQGAGWDCQGMLPGWD